MMLITAVVAPSRVEAVKRALGLFGVKGMTLSRVFGPARTGQPVEIYRAARWVASLVPRARLEILAGNADTPDLVRVISRAVDGAEVDVWVVRVDHLVRIRTGEVGLDALD
jgi:nitrogen regulatory protein P-II 1